MRRTRSDGTKFQEEVKKKINKLSTPIYQIRLHTTNVRAISDFILLGKRTIILEVKETSQKSFSTKTMQQAELVAQFREFYKTAQEEYKDCAYDIFVLVHFITQDKYVVYDLLNDPAVLHTNDTYCKTFDDLLTALKYIAGDL